MLVSSRPISLTLALALLLSAPRPVSALSNPFKLPWSTKKKILPAFSLQGVQVLPAQEVAAAVGNVPGTVTATWCGNALRRVLALYRQRGYEQVRGWVVRPDGKTRNGRRPFALQIDEGKMHTISFVGANTLKTLIFRVELYLPKNVFHRPTLRESLDRIRKKYNLRSAYYRVREVGPTMPGPRGGRIKRRELRLYFLTRESFGWGVGLSLSSTYGLVPKLSVAKPRLLFAQDRLAARVGLAFPYREYLFTESPKFTWVHGFLELDYRLSRLSRRFTPRLSTRAALSRLRRTDIQLDRFMLTRATTLAYFDALLWGPLALELGLGHGYTQAWDQQPAQGVDEATFPSRSINVFVSQLRAQISLGKKALRRDMQSELAASSRVEYGGSDAWILRHRLKAQVVLNWRFHDLILQLRGESLHGESNYWDQAPLSDFLRVDYDNRYWVEEVATASIGLRIGLISDRLKIGIFHDLAVFGDREGGKDPELAFANAFGPSLHLLFFDAFSLDAYYGFGFGPPGFDHSMVFSVRKVF